MKKRKRLYNKRGTWNKRGRKFSDDMSKLIGKELKKHPNYDILDMEHIIGRSIGYAGVMLRLREAQKRQEAKD